MLQNSSAESADWRWRWGRNRSFRWSGRRLGRYRIVGRSGQPLGELRFFALSFIKRVVEGVFGSHRGASRSSGNGGRNPRGLRTAAAASPDLPTADSDQDAPVAASSVTDSTRVSTVPSRARVSSAATPQPRLQGCGGFPVGRGRRPPQPGLREWSERTGRRAALLALHGVQPA